MTPSDPVYPFTAVVGQDLLKRALLLNAVCPALGGVLIAGDRGTAKTTAARGLAALLPLLAAIHGCPYHCDPASLWPDCPHCRGVINRESMDIPAPFVELPLGATEDRVAGSIDIERTLREGRPAFRPGLLATAHRGVLYIDEVNLLADHLTDLLLDAAASGVHTVERESIAVRHPAQFILIGTMNPEEGELRPQLADRFGLRVSVTTLSDPASRAEVVRRRLAFDADPAGFSAAWAGAQQRLSQQLAAARALYPEVALTEEQLGRIAAVCCAHRVEGLRADLALGRASRALAALAGRTAVIADDLQAAAELILPHRMRRLSGNPPPSTPNPLPDLFSAVESRELRVESREPRVIDSRLPTLSTLDSPETVAPPAPPQTMPRLEAGTERKTTAPDRGRRNRSPGQARGRHVGAVHDETADDVALDATLRAAVLRGGVDGPLTVRPEDVHRKVRDDRSGSLVVFVVDASGSMGARRRMEAVKAAVLGLLVDAGRLRDEVAVIAVRGPRAEILLTPTRDVAVAERALTRLPTGGRTPLAHGLTLAAELVNRTVLPFAARRPALLILVSDGKANVPLPGTDGDPWSQVLAACAGFARPNLTAVVIDAEEGFVKTGRVPELAAALSAECLPLAELQGSMP